MKKTAARLVALVALLTMGVARLWPKSRSNSIGIPITVLITGMPVITGIT